MSDFFTRIAERALGTSPRINPQAASRYAPARLPLSEMPPFEVQSEADAVPHSNLAKPRDSSSQPSNRGIDLEGVNEIATADERPKDEVSSLPAESEPISADVAADQIQSQPTRELQPGPDPVADEDYQQSSKPERAKSLSSRDESAMQTVPREPGWSELSASDSGEVPKQPTRLPREDQNEAALDDATHRPSFEPTADPRTIKDPLVRSLRPTAASPNALLDDDSIGDGSRTIRVTIGRIEVNAVAPPPPAAEPSGPPPPKLSLDEFLRQHNGRRG